MNNFGYNNTDDSGLDIEMEATLLELGESLRALQSTHFSPMSRDAKSRIRAHMFERIQDAIPGEADVENESYLLDRLISWIRTSSQKVVLSPVRRAIIREKLYALPAHSPFAPWFSGGLVKKLTASFSLGGVLALSLFAYVLRVPVTYAREFTVVHEVSGNVQVVRDGQTSPAQQGFELKEGDELRTGDDGRVEVKYFDKSFTRLFANTDVAFQSLRSENFGIDHLVELDLERGTLWSSVFDFVKNSDFKVRANDLVTSASKRATFSVSSENGTSQVQVFQNAVNVSLPQKPEEKVVEAKTVVKGFQLVADAAVGSSVAKSRVEPIQLKDTEKEWVSVNLKKDAQLIDDAQNQNQGVVAGPLGALQENASLLLAFDDNERFKLELNIAEKSFYEVFGRADVKADEVRTSFNQLETTARKADGIQNDDVKKLAAAVLQSARSKLLSAKPDSSLYDVKVALEERDFADAPEEQKLSVALDQASQFLAEAQVLQDKGLKDAYMKALNKYRQRIKDVDVLVAAKISKKLALDADVSARRSSLEVQYVALKNPVSVVPKSEEVGETPVVAVIKPTSSDTTNKAPEVVKVPTDQSDVLDDTQLPPKLQLSRD
ncbi:MAG: DUF5667 domain-containing protein [Candidatus Peregrinibacteria bacterium]|nr:DUF5667 domain-containing protein [Candidatus Peregrinibacteria bacterium]